MELNDLMELMMYKAYQGMNVSKGESTSASSSEPWKPDNVEEAFAAIKDLVQQQLDKEAKGSNEETHADGHHGLTEKKANKMQEYP